MINREKIIEGLRELHGSEETMKLISDTIKLLKEQEAVEPKRKNISPDDIDWFCGKCGACVRRLDNYCSRCGREVKWE